MIHNKTQNVRQVAYATLCKVGEVRPQPFFVRASRFKHGIIVS